MAAGFRNQTETGSALTVAELLWVQTGSAGVLLLAEQSSSPSATSGYGKIYVKTNKNLYYLNEDGTEVQIGSSGGFTIETPPETPDGVITVFTVTAEPRYVVGDGITYFASVGYTYAALAITFTIPPSQYVRAII